MVDRLVVVGGGAAGMSAASAARRVAPDLDVVVLETSNHAAWGLCGLPYYLSGVVEDWQSLVALSDSDIRDRGIDLRRHASAVELDIDQQIVTVRTPDGMERLDYRALVVAGGASPVVPPVPGLDGSRVFTVRSLDHARDLRGLLASGSIGRAVVIGAGYIGLEMAEAIAATGARVVVVEALPRIMATLDPEVADLVAAEVGRHVDLRIGVAVTAVACSESGAVVHLGDGATLEADAVIVATGVRPGGGLAVEAGARATREGAVVVDDRMRTSLPGVWAAGDCAAVPHLVLGRPAYIPLAPTANKTGRVAGTVAAGGDARFAGMVGSAVVKVFDLTIARTGLTLAEAEAEGLDGVAVDTTSRSRAKYYPGGDQVHIRLVAERSGRLLGAQLVSRDPAAALRVNVVATALHAGMDVTDLGALDLVYAPPYAPVWDPLHRAAQAAARQVRSPTREPNDDFEPRAVI